MNTKRWLKRNKQNDRDVGLSCQHVADADFRLREVGMNWLDDIFLISVGGFDGNELRKIFGVVVLCRWADGRGRVGIYDFLGCAQEHL